MQAFCAQLLGRGPRSRDWIHLSDGGPDSQNLAFSLLQRGCADIVCIDAGADPERVCSDLSRLMLLAREELNVDLVQLSTWQIGLPELGPQGRHCALFQIDYPNGRQGRMLYIKTALYDGGEIAPVDAVSYWKQHPAFPHESTVNQFFTDAQFVKGPTAGRTDGAAAAGAAHARRARRPSTTCSSGRSGIWSRASGAAIRREARCAGGPAGRQCGPTSRWRHCM